MANNIVKQIIDGTWSITMEWADGISYGGPARIVIEAIDPQTAPLTGLSSTVLRDVDFKSAVSEFRANNNVQDVSANQIETLKELRLAGVTPRYLAKLSEVYLEQATSKSHPVMALSDLLGISFHTLRTQLHRAGKEGYLDRRPGHVGGALTDKAKELLK